jgi:hypothetical protein
MRLLHPRRQILQSIGNTRRSPLRLPMNLAATNLALRRICKIPSLFALEGNLSETQLCRPFGCCLWEGVFVAQKASSTRMGKNINYSVKLEAAEYCCPKNLQELSRD